MLPVIALCLILLSIHLFLCIAAPRGGSRGSLYLPVAHSVILFLLLDHYPKQLFHQHQLLLKDGVQ